MRLSKYFDVTNLLHIKALEERNRTGFYPSYFVEEMIKNNVQPSYYCIRDIKEKLVDTYINLKLNELKQKQTFGD